MVAKSQSFDKLILMISSRCSTPLSDIAATEFLKTYQNRYAVDTEGTGIANLIPTLEELREVLKERIENIQIGETGKIIEVWKNDETPSVELTETTVSACLARVIKADIVLVLYSGESGFQASSQKMGICHREAAVAFSNSRRTTILIDIQSLVRLKGIDDETKKRNSEMASWIEDIDPYIFAAANIEQFLAKVEENIAELLVKFTKSARTFFSGKSARSQGEALDWSRQPLAERQKNMVEALSKAFEESVIQEDLAEGHHAKIRIWKFKTEKVPVILSAVPGPMSQVAPREIWGRPDLLEHKYEGSAFSRFGPLHVVAVRGGVTEIQARNLLNNANAFVADTDFGVWASETTNGAQFLFLKDCLDPLSTLGALGDAERWLIRENELKNVFIRGRKRQKILKVMRE